MPIDRIGYALPAPLPGSGRESFSPDASFYDGQLPLNLMMFIEGVPLLAVEVRSQNDYGPSAEREMAEKREDYALAGTQVIWDVDPVAETIAKYDAANLAAPTIYHRGDAADAEPALPGLRLNVDDLFASS